MSPAARMLDANFNRAREALRVMEDAARFALNDAALSRQFKSMRHELREIVAARLPPGVMEATRDTPGDVGTAISTTAEMMRSGLLDVVIAAGKRLSESLRVIEEVCKIGHQQSAESTTTAAANAGLGAAARIESMRYRAYELDKQLQLQFGSGRAQQWKLCVVLTKSLCKRPWQQVVQEAIAGGADCIQIREKDMHARELLQHVRQVINIALLQGASGSRATIIVNDRVDIALAAGADGVHLGQEDMAVHDVRKLAGRSMIIGVSAHTLNEGRAAVEAGSDYCGVGTMFATAIKPDLAITGPAFLKAFIEQHPNTPHLAIGGITPANIHLIAQAGGQGVAVSSAVCSADSPKIIVERIINAIRGS